MHLVGKQAYKFELSKKWKIYNIFHILLLKQDITKKGQIDKNVTKLAKLNADNNKSGEYKIEAIFDNTVYAGKLKSGYLLGLYYLVFWKSYLEEKNI